ncbi:MAG: hypothetical protein V8S08_02050 [Lachnoclostridium sp.]
MSWRTVSAALKVKSLTVLILRRYMSWMRVRAVLELFHGPTLAFKDVALQILPRFLKYAKAKEGEPCDILILVATSGDTGKAAL